MTRRLDRCGAATSAEEDLQRLSALRRAGARARLSHSRPVGGPLLAGLLLHLMESRGAREVEVLRASEVAERHHGRWICALRDLTRARALRSWIWVERWAELFGFDPALLALAAASPDEVRVPR